MNVGELVETTRSQLHGSHRGQFNFLALPLDDTETDVVLEDELRGAVQGALLALDDEIVYVRSASTAGKTATVARAWMGTEAAPHATRAAVEISPRFPRFSIKSSLRDEIRSWGSGVFRIDSFDVDLGTNARAVDLSFLEEGWYQLLSVVRTPRAGSDADLAVRGRTVRHSASYPEGAFVLEHPLEAAATVTVTVGLPFDLSVWDDTTDLIDDCGLTEQMLDIPPIGACWRLLSPREVTRLDPGAQGEPRSAQEVQGGMIAATARGYKQLRDTRLADETYRMRSRYPWRS